MKLSKLNLARTALVMLLLAVLVLVILNPSRTALIVVGAAAIFLFVLVRWHAARTVYVCPVCNHNFRISAWIDFVSPHTPASKWLNCPSCSAQAWCRIS